MGVDFCLPAGAPIRAIDSGTVLGINPDWFDGEPYVWYRMEHPFDSQHSVSYVAEEIDLDVTVGEHVSAGQTLGTFAASGTCIETGWGDPAGSGWTLAQVTTGYVEGQATAAGNSFRNFLAALGVVVPAGAASAASRSSSRSLSPAAAVTTAARRGATTRSIARKPKVHHLSRPTKTKHRARRERAGATPRRSYRSSPSARAAAAQRLRPGGVTAPRASA